MSDADRMNHFPTSPLVSVTQVICGELRLLPPGSDWQSARDKAPLPAHFVMGPQDMPVTSWAPAEVEAITVGFYPDAWIRLGGSHDYKLAPQSIVAAMAQFAPDQDPDGAWQAFCETLNATWTHRRPAGWHDPTGIADWSRSVFLRAAMSGTGRSLRSLERRIKRLSGHTRRTLNFFSAFENLHRISCQKSDSPLAEIAVEAGYSDQSHMGRAVRRATGFSPALLNQAIETEEAFWFYRLVGERF